MAYKKTAACVIALLSIFCLIGCGKTASQETHKQSINWRTNSTAKYLNDDAVTSIICVQADEKSSARILMFEKAKENGKTIWTATLECHGFIGRKGLGKTKENDIKTPIGDFGVTTAFGIKENPGTKLPYVDVTDDIYCCADETAYNRIINIKDYPHDCSEGEHLIDYTPEYNYGFCIDYNKECTVGLGTAIFFHCVGANPYTGGCIVVSEENLIDILQTIDENTRVIIDYAL